MHNLTRRDFIKIAGLNTTVLAIGALPLFSKRKNKNPNIIYILADDLGYGDISKLNSESKIVTSNIDKLAENGIYFVDAHSGSAVCTPTRYGILTGRYNWRTKLQNGVTWGYSDPLIDADRMTVASFLSNSGYSTACIGKWHLGWNWGIKEEYEKEELEKVEHKHVDYRKPILNGPADLGFDYFFGIPASLDMEPYVYIENKEVVELPASFTDGKNKYEFYRSGPCAPNFIHEDVLTTFTKKAIKYIDQQSNKIVENPFFLYLPLSAPHTPIMPSKEFKGKSGIGAYGDFVLQCDSIVGQIVESVKRNGLEEDTLIIFTSDNGCSPMANFNHLGTVGHNPSYKFRGAKADIYEGGHRIPFIASWPGNIPINSVCTDPICLTDLLATTSDIVARKLPDSAAGDSVSILTDLKGTSNEPLREAIVHHSIDGFFSIRKGKWKLELCPGSGGWSKPRDFEAINQKLPMVQLFNLENDIGEKTNLQDQYPEVVHELTKLLEQYVSDGRSTPGRKQNNDVKVDIWKYLKNRKDDSKIIKVKHLGEKAEIKKINNAIISHSILGLKALNDGIRGSLSYQDGNWLGVEGNDMIIELSFPKSVAICSIEIGFLEDHSSWIFSPINLNIIAESSTGKYNNVSEIVNPRPIKHAEKGVKEILISNLSLETQKLRLEIEALKKCPSWHDGNGDNAWMFLDEIIIN